jgi:hypothetical protein
MTSTSSGLIVCMSITRPRCLPRPAGSLPAAPRRSITPVETIVASEPSWTVIAVPISTT